MGDVLGHGLGQPVVREYIVQKISPFYVFQYQVYEKQPCQSTRNTPQKLIEIEHKILTEIMTSLLGNERLPEPTDIGMVERLQDTDFPRKTRELVAVTLIVLFASLFIIVRAELLRVDDLDGPPLSRIACHRLHHRRERAATELVRHVVERVDARQLHRREVPVDETIILERVLLLHRRAESDLISVSQDA